MTRKILFLCLAVLFLIITSGVCGAENPPEPKLSIIKVDGPVEIGKTIYVTIKNLKKYLDLPGKNVTEFKLYLDWIKIDQVEASFIPITGNENDGILRFDIRHGDSDAAKKAWATLLGKPFTKGRGISAPVKVSVGYKQDPPAPLESGGPNGTLVIVSKLNLTLLIVVIALLLAGVVALVINTGIVRTPFPDIPLKERPYSLARMQIAFWFFLVASSFFFLWVMTDRLDTLTGSVLVLIGISGTTYIVSAALSSPKDNEAFTKRKQLAENIANLKTTVEKLKDRISATPAPANLVDLQDDKMGKDVELLQLESELVDSKESLLSKGFVKDLISDGIGVSLPRFQIAVWTVLLGIVFVTSVLESMAMPQFDATLLGLMGISGGTYIGFKFPENK
jgi:hypothetical protein